MVRRAPALTWVTQGVLAGGAAAALVILLVSGLLLVGAVGQAGRSPGTTGPVAGASASTSATGDESDWRSQDASTYPTNNPYAQSPGQTYEDTSVPSLGPTVNLPPLDPTTFAAARVVGGIPCVFSGRQPIPAANGRVYLACTTEVDAFDLATNRVVARYPGLSQNNLCPMACIGPLPNVVVLDNAGGLWTSALISWNWTTARFDIASGTVTKRLAGYWLMGGGTTALYVWGGGSVADVSMRTGEIGSADSVGESFPSPGPAPDDRTTEWSGYTQVACGKLLASRGTDGQTELSYAGWQRDAHESGDLVEIEQLGGACWGLFSDGSDVYQGPYHLARLGQSGVDRRSPEMPGRMRAFNGDLWLERGVVNGRPAAYQRLDATTWTLVGVPWTVPDTCYEMFGSGGAIWCSDGGTVNRMDIAASGIPLSPSPSPSSSASAGPSISGSPAPSISPSDAPSISPSDLPSASTGP